MSTKYEGLFQVRLGLFLPIAWRVVGVTQRPRCICLLITIFFIDKYYPSDLVPIDTFVIQVGNYYIAEKLAESYSS